MPTTLELKTYTQRLEERYKRLIEKAYNFKYTDSALSDFAEFKAKKLKEKINRIKFGN